MLVTGNGLPLTVVHIAGSWRGPMHRALLDRLVAHRSLSNSLRRERHLIEGDGAKRTPIAVTPQTVGWFAWGVGVPIHRTSVADSGWLCSAGSDAGSLWVSCGAGAHVGARRINPQSPEMPLRRYMSASV